MSHRIAKGFDMLAPVYDALARMIIGKGIVESQKYFLDKVPAEGNVLILGGGTGWLLPLLTKGRPQLHIDYIELSERMLRKARRHKGQIQFIQGTQQDIPAKKYDLIITNFYLDLFPDTKLEDVLLKIKTSMTTHSQWIVTDFVNTRPSHRIMLWLMYRFFRLVAGIEAKTLPAWTALLDKAGARIESEKLFSNGFIKTVLFRF